MTCAARWALDQSCCTGVAGRATSHKLGGQGCEPWVTVLSVLLASARLWLATVASSTGWSGRNGCSNRKLTCAHLPPAHSLDGFGLGRARTTPAREAASIGGSWYSRWHINHARERGGWLRRGAGGYSRMPQKSRAPTTAVAPTLWCATNIICATPVSDAARTPGAPANRLVWRQRKCKSMDVHGHLGHHLPLIHCHHVHSPHQHHRLQRPGSLALAYAHCFASPSADAIRLISNRPGAGPAMLTGTGRFL